MDEYQCGGKYREVDRVNTQVTVKHCDGGVMVRECRAASGVWELIFIAGIMDQFFIKTF